MAVTVLSPWPTTPAALAKARTCVRGAINAGGSVPDERIDALGSAAATLIERFAPSAPQPVKNEAVIRLAAWMKRSPASDFVPTSVGSLDFAWRPTASRNALRNSSAAGLLSPWRRPRGLVVGKTG